MTKALATAIVLVATLSTAACTGETDKSGGPAAPTTLVMASNDGTEIDGAPAVERFVEQVEARSDGRLRIEVSPEWRIQGEGRVLRDVAAGKADLGWSGTRAFDTIGVDSFRPLHAPFLVDSYAAQAAVVSDGLAQDMLDDLDATGLTGLALLGDELRFPAAAEGPVLEVADFEELVFGIMPSNTQAAAVAALGGRAKALSAPHPPGTDGAEALETSWSTYLSNSMWAFMPFVTGNVAFWPRTTVIVVNTDALTELREEDRAVLTQAAEEAAAWSIEHADDRVSVEMKTACEKGSRIATASPGQLAELRMAAQPAYDSLRAEPKPAELLAQIEKLVGNAHTEPLEVPDGCAYRRGDEDLHAVPVLPAVLSGPGQPGDLPAGTYRYTITPDGLRADDDYAAPFIQANAGVWTWTLGDGLWSYDMKPYADEIPEGFPDGTTCEGYYDVHGQQVDFTTVTVYAHGECASQTWKADWRATEEGLSMDVTTDGSDLDFLFGSEVWQRIE